MSLEKAIQKLTNAITTAKMDRSLMGGPHTPSMTQETYGSVSINGENCVCVEQVVGSKNTFCVRATCPTSGKYCQLMDYGWSCQSPFKPSSLNRP